ncbi:uncharacterized protein CXQ87_000296 [Candidozyma duobushaemuli]|uniref:Exocyst complex component Sec8 n=2 Tax=Candidozyma TaxID=3303203 RepID=A0ABX8I271_9ASCO|nr:uncharacterized protein CXQ87_000296 [[Candida] duobushaemulonis]PVH17411.1 hypothetical protein CXQ87_000296 [[Candida] duobushaemulonis]QWU86052.1 hypothetical protein CA3LBN_000270 [[Candida] haemuloni]
MGNRRRAVSMAFNGSMSEDDERKTKKSIADIKTLYKDIRYDWSQLTTGDTTPIELAIAFLDDTSVGLAHRKAEFDDLCESTSDTLRRAVVENHEIFNNSVGSFHMLMSIAKESQDDSASIKNLIESSTRDMNDRMGVLKELDSSSEKYSEMLEILDAIESLHQIPDTVDKLAADKELHKVYDTISEGYKIAAKYNLWHLPALAGIQSYLDNQSNSLYDMIVDELRNEIYLKNSSVFNSGKEFWIDHLSSNNPQIASFKTLIKSSNNLESYIYNSANLDIGEIASCFAEPAATFIEHQLPKIHAHYSKVQTSKADYSLILEYASSANSESFYYLYMLLTTASKLNRLNSVLEILVSSVQVELHDLINRTTQECKQRNLPQLARLAKAVKFEFGSGSEKISGQTFNDAAVPILQDFFSTIITKATVVLSKHKVICEVVKLIESSHAVGSTGRDSSVGPPSPTYDFNTIWNLLKKEIEALIVSYIYDDNTEDGAKHAQDLNQSSNKLHHILANKQLFKFDNVSSGSISKTTEDMTMVLNEMFPGFSPSSKKGSIQNSEVEVSPYITNEQFNSLAEDLVPKNIFNMRIILEFFLVFISASQEMLTDFGKNKGLNLTAYQFFYDFMKNSFHRKLHNDLNLNFERCMVGELDQVLATEGNLNVKFTQETINLNDDESENQALASFHRSNSAANRVYANANNFRRLFNHTCHSLNTSFTYRRDISDLALNLLKKFAKAYNDYFKELLATGVGHDITEMGIGIGERSKHISQINKWLKTPALLEMSGGILQHHDDLEGCAPLITKEIDLMLFKSNHSPNIFDITKDDLFDDEWFDQVCYLLLTASWILSWLPSMRKESNYTIYETGIPKAKVSEVDKLRHDWSILENGRSTFAIAEKTQNVYLTLNSAKIGEFDEVIQTFESIRDQTLIALRYDLRLKALYYIGKSYRENFVLGTEPADSDQFIGQYNREVYSIGTKISERLSSAETDCVFVGLPNFLTRSFLQGSEMIQVANKNGIKKILLNIITIQQMLRSVMKEVDHVDFSRASRYFELFTASEHVLLQKVSESKDAYTREEVLNLLRLIYSEKLQSGNASSFNKSKFGELSRKISDIFV